MTGWTTAKKSPGLTTAGSPHYLQIRKHFADKIECGEIVPYTQLPTERQISEKFSISRMTARQALLQLETEGLAYRRRGLGWFVAAPRLMYDPIANISFTENAIAQGRRPATILLSKEEIPAPAWLTQHLPIAEGDPLHRVHRLRLIDERPVLLELIYLSAATSPGLLELPLELSFTQTLAENFDIKLQRSKIRLRSIVLDTDQAEALDTGVGTPGLYLTRTSLDQNGNPVEFDEEFWLHSVLELQLDLSKVISN